MPLPIEMVVPKWTSIIVHLMISLAVCAFEDVRTWLPFFGGYSVYVLVFFATPRFLPVMFGRMSSIALSTPRDVRSTAECRMPLFPTVLALWNSWVHIHTTNSGDISSNVEMSVD